MEVLSWVLFGFVVGLIARALLPGRDPMGLVATTVLGIIGAVLGAWSGRALGLYGPGQNAGYLGATVGAVFVLLIYHNTFHKQRRRTPSVERSTSSSEKRDRAA